MKFALELEPGQVLIFNATTEVVKGLESGRIFERVDRPDGPALVDVGPLLPVTVTDAQLKESISRGEAFQKAKLRAVPAEEADAPEVAGQPAP